MQGGFGVDDEGLNPALGGEHPDSGGEFCAVQLDGLPDDAETGWFVGFGLFDIGDEVTVGFELGFSVGAEENLEVKHAYWGIGDALQEVAFAESASDLQAVSGGGSSL